MCHGFEILMTRSDWILAALHIEINRRRAVIDADPTLKEMLFVIQFPSAPHGMGGVKTKFEHAMIPVKIEGLDNGCGR